MPDFVTIAALSAVGWISVARRNPIGAVMVVVLAFFLGAEHV